MNLLLISLFLWWDYPLEERPGTWFEVWHATSIGCLSWAGGTNIPSGFTLMTITDETWVPIEPGQEKEFFLVRARNLVGVSDWNQ